MALDIGANVRVKGVYCDEGCTIPVSGTITDIFGFDGRPRFVVSIDEATKAAGYANGMTAVPPGGEFWAERLEAV